MDKTTTTKVIQKLIHIRYIRKERDAIDQRMWRLYPEEKGLELYEFVIQDENRNIKICFTNFSNEEKIIAFQLVEKMRKNIENEWKETKNIRSDDYGEKS